MAVSKCLLDVLVVLVLTSLSWLLDFPTLSKDVPGLGGFYYALKSLPSKYTVFIYDLFLSQDDKDFFNHGWNTSSFHPCVEGSDWLRHKSKTQPNVYVVLADETPLEGRRVLEVGSGRGGGAALLAKCFCPKQIIGIDLVPKQVSMAQSKWASNGACPVEFMEGDAQQLPFEDHSFDVVYNVESSHLYPDFEKFYYEVKRVLKPKGTFLYTDVFPTRQLGNFTASIEKVFEQRVAPIDMTEPWIQSCLMIRDTTDPGYCPAEIPLVKHGALKYLRFRIVVP